MAKCADGDDDSVGGSIGEGVAETFAAGGGGSKWKRGCKARFWERKPAPGSTDGVAGSDRYDGPAAGDNGWRLSMQSEDRLSH